MGEGVYIVPWAGRGSRKDPFQPRGIEAGEPGVGSIDLRPDASRRDGYAIVYRPEGRIKGALKFGDTFEAVFGGRIRDKLHNRLGVNLGRASRADLAIATLMHRPNGWNPVRPGIWGERAEIWLAGKLVWSAPVARGGASDTFTYSDGELASVSGGIWANDPFSLSTMNVTSQTVEVAAEDGQTFYYYVGAAVTADHYSQCVDVAVGFGAGGPAVRIGGFTGQSVYVYWPAFDQPLKYVNGSFSAVGGGMTPSYETNDVMKLQVEGTSLSVYLNGVEATGSPVTDSSISGVGNGAGISADEVQCRLDNWEGADLVSPSGPPRFRPRMRSRGTSW